MKRQEKNGTTNPEELLHLWMGESSETLPPTRGGPPRMIVLVGLACAVVVSVVLAKYAVDVLLMLVALAAIGFLLHFVGMWLADSNLLSPTWFSIIVLTIGLLAYAVVVPATQVAGLARFVPASVVRFFAWSESRGWAQRVLIGPSEGTGTAPSSTGAGPGSEGTAPAGATASPGGSGGQATGSFSPGSVDSRRVTLFASQATSVLGEPLYLTARLIGESNSVGTVRFQDGSRLLGAADVRTEGQTRLAYLTVRGLSVGQHRITAHLGGTTGLASATSAPVVHVVIAPAIR